MKKLFLILTMLSIAFLSEAQIGQVKTITGKLITLGKESRVTTTDSTLTAIDSLVLSNNSGGIVEVSVVGVDTAGNTITGKIIYRYKKVASTLTLASGSNISALSADAALSPATFTFTASSANNLLLSIKGKLATSIRWRWRLQPLYP
jgi:hypothetical protein